MQWEPHTSTHPASKDYYILARLGIPGTKADWPDFSSQDTMISSF